jgi:hypothetical protein
MENTLVPSAGVAYVSYKYDDVSKRENGIAATLGASVRPMQQLSFDLQAQFLSNRIVQSDLRLFGKVNFWFTSQL